MNRLGFPSKKPPRSRRALDQNHGIALVMSHFWPRDRRRIIRSTTSRSSASARSARCSAASRPRSRIPPGIFLGQSAHYDLVRPGVALYGGNPTPGKPNPMQPVVELKAASCRCATSTRRDRRLRATWTAQRPTPHRDRHRSAMRTASSAPRAASDAEARRRRADRRGALPHRRPRLDGPDRGRRHRPAECQRAGAATSSTLIGDGIDVDELAARAGTIGYEVLTSLGRRYRRVYTRRMTRSCIVLRIDYPRTLELRR